MEQSEVFFDFFVMSRQTVSIWQRRLGSAEVISCVKGGILLRQTVSIWQRRLLCSAEVISSVEGGSAADGEYMAMKACSSTEVMSCVEGRSLRQKRYMATKASL